ncbi:MAG: hypothetical protein P857_677 [Candidatus Xenolissoclinum pacificiensis L6]|uniref:Preprotein translocase subunit SecE n=1 Tax=Candidatus Xenolissoclinum pacificiensis L6 TaxID=1401685 RepID=W2V182_9RICK|nr:MAG: hypothetical protein P857_677 [Candidatus Xenolissoclinum pacificiensis L6]
MLGFDALRDISWCDVKSATQFSVVVMMIAVVCACFFVCVDWFWMVLVSWFLF